MGTSDDTDWPWHPLDLEPVLYIEADPPVRFERGVPACSRCGCLVAWTGSVPGEVRFVCSACAGESPVFEFVASVPEGEGGDDD